MPRNPMSTIRMLGETLLKLPLHKSFTINGIAEKSRVHWKTSERFLNLIYFIQQRLPIIEMKDKNGTKLISVIKMPLIMKHPPQIQLMIRMYLSGIVSPSTATSIKNLSLLDDEKEFFQGLIEANYIIKTSRGYFLSPMGVSTVLGDVHDFYQEFGEREPEITEPVEPITINPGANPNAVRARALSWPFQEQVETASEIITKS